ncbi:MAG: FtsX-like permease family protein [Gemmatimonadaceae bacterium]|nr:FtsX-like permease family protein [Gemmatimonadaceae bacterium]
MSGLELSIAWRYLRSRRGSRFLSFISVIAVAGVAVGVSALIVIMGVMNGLQTDLRDKILVGSPDIRVLTYGEALRMERWPEALAMVEATRGVVRAAPFVITQALASNGRHIEAVTVGGIVPGDSGSAQVTTIRDHALQGAFQFKSTDPSVPGIVVGRLLADRLGAYPGMRISLLTAPGGMPSLSAGLVSLPRFIQFEVTGTFETLMYEYDNGYAYIQLEQAQRLAGLDSAVTGLEVLTVDKERAPVIALALLDTLGFPYRAEDWQQQNSSLFRALKLEKLGMSVILTLIIMVAAFNIVSTLTMVVRDKTREIGILKAMGMRAESIRRIFLLQGTFIGAFGTGIGLALGLGTGYALERWKLIALDPSVYFIDHLPVRLELFDVLLILALSVGVAIVATLHPAGTAARLYPIEAIRNE